MHSEQEIWKAIPGCEGRYEVSSVGRVRSLLRGGRILKAALRGRGYLMVAPVIGGKNVTRQVHHLVLAAFVGPRPEGMVGCHANDVPFDNRVENLRWDTPANNVLDRIRRGRYSKHEKLTIESARAIYACTAGELATAREFQIDRSIVRDIRAGKSWKRIHTTD
jgi:hypothetical protein